ncbi:unnamed protein product [Schistosoma mattheei]|uniref:Uncharacterized protein n=1 Tax=Schistosoma mattheei TaxID=31246 RepID=A0AA85BE50_9TREM|nr:unnamed protein product [Schistosoma mattheei]
MNLFTDKCKEWKKRSKLRLLLLKLGISEDEMFCNFIVQSSQPTQHSERQNVYPSASFTDFVAFGLHLKTCDNPDVKKYIFDCIESLRHQISEINEFRVVIKSISASPFESKPIESLVLQFNKLNEEFIRQDICFSLLQEYFATILIRLKILDSFLQPLEFETTWEPWVHFCSSSCQNENPTMSWSLIPNNNTNVTNSGSVYPIKSFQTEDIQMQVFLLQY